MAAELWVLPNPSGLNAHEGIDTLAAAYRAAWDAAQPSGESAASRRRTDRQVTQPSSLMNSPMSTFTSV